MNTRNHKNQIAKFDLVKSLHMSPKRQGHDGHCCPPQTIQVKGQIGNWRCLKYIFSLSVQTSQIKKSTINKSLSLSLPCLSQFTILLLLPLHFLSLSLSSNASILLSSLFLLVLMHINLHDIYYQIVIYRRYIDI